ncbi:MAG: OmpA family protein [Prevotella sp.]|nr:OmpA family protein [Prevotella sp.]
MKKFRLFAVLLSMGIVFSGCNNTQKGAGIGAGGGALLGAIVGKIAGNTAVGAAVGGAVGAGAGALIGKKMDKAKAEAEAVKNAQVESVTDANGLQAVKVTFDSGILFASGSATLSSTASTSLFQFAQVLKNNAACDVAVQGYTDNDPWKNSTAEQSVQKNLELSQNRAQAVTTYLLSQGVPSTQIRSTMGYGESNPVADNSTAAGKAQNRRVEVYLYASEAMIKAAEAGTLQ